MKRIFIVAGGTGGHIFPGLALARAFLEKGEQVFWLGNSFGMENKIICHQNIPFMAVDFRNFRKNGFFYRLQLPFFLIRSFVRSLVFFSRVRPHLVIGMGGYVCVPGYLASFFLRIPLAIHEQNAIPGMANRLFSRLARLRFCGFPKSLMGGQYVGNPIRSEFFKIPDPQTRFCRRQGPLRILILGGSQGTSIFNDVVPRAVSRLPSNVAPIIYHQSGFAAKHQVCRAYGDYKTATVFDFREDILSLYQEVDFIICRSGAMTVSEIGVIGLAALFVPYPYAVDDHQTMNAQFFGRQGAAYVLPQSGLSEQWLYDFLLGLTRASCLNMSLKAHQIAKTNATEEIVRACYKYILEV